MSVKIRLQRHGRKQAPFYHIVVADSRSPRDGKFIEKLGTYNPMTNPATIVIDRDAAFDWLMKGAQPTDTARSILRFNGVLYRKHLDKGVRKGALTQEQADAKYNDFVNSKMEVVEKRKETIVKENIDFHKKLFGTPIEKKVAPVEVVEEAPVAEDAVEEAPATDEAPAAE